MLEERTTTYYSNNNSNKYLEIFLVTHMKNLNEKKSKTPLKSRERRLNQMGRPMILTRTTQSKHIGTFQVNV